MVATADDIFLFKSKRRRFEEEDQFHHTFVNKMKPTI